MHVDNNNNEDDAVLSSSIAKQPIESDKKTGRKIKDKQKKRQVLEVEDDEQRLTRIQNLLENINTPSQSQSQYPSPSPPAAHFSSASVSSTGFMPVPLNSNLPPSKPSFIPKSEVLSRVELFLPQLLQANTELLQQAQNDPSSVDIENLSDAQEAYIEMNLGLGVFEERRRRNTDDTNSDSDPDSSDDGDNDDTDGDGDSNKNIDTSSSDSTASDSDLTSSSEESDVTEAEPG